MVINDFLRGKIPWYIPDPSWPERKAKEKDEEEFGVNEGRLGEMRLKVGSDENTEDCESWDGLDVDGDDEDEDGEDEIVSNEVAMSGNENDSPEYDRIEDSRPPKRAKVSLD